MLMDRELPDSERQKIRAIAMAHPEVKALHELRTRASGPSMFIQFHLEMDGGMSLYAAHQVADQVEEEILAAYPDCEVIIHQDPSGVAERRKTFG